MRLEMVTGGATRLAERSSVWLADRIWAAVAERGAAHLALSGGSTPLPMFVALAILPVPWEHTHLWQVDERVAPEGDDARNATGLHQHLLTRVPIPPEHVHLMDVTDADIDAAADRYGAELGAACGGVLDIVHLGVGDDGHTASWPPGDPVLEVRDRDVATTAIFNEYRRMTLTVPAVNRARHVMFLIEGEAKAPVVRRLLDGDTSIPAAEVRKTGVTLLADEAAGSA